MIQIICGSNIIHFICLLPLKNANCISMILDDLNYKKKITFIYKCIPDLKFLYLYARKKAQWKQILFINLLLSCEFDATFKEDNVIHNLFFVTCQTRKLSLHLFGMNYVGMNDRQSVGTCLLLLCCFGETSW